MTMDQLPFSVRYRALDSVKLLREIDTGPARLNHRNDRGKVTMSAFEPDHQLGVTRVIHRSTLQGERISKGQYCRSSVMPPNSMSRNAAGSSPCAAGGHLAKIARALGVWSRDEMVRID